MELGYERTTTRLIATKVGIADGTLFNYFKDKASLLFTVFLEDRRKELLALKLPDPNTLDIFVDGIIKILDISLRKDNEKQYQLFKTYYHQTKVKMFYGETTAISAFFQENQVLFDSVNDYLKRTKISPKLKDQLYEILYVHITGLYEEFNYWHISLDDFLDKVRNHIKIILKPYI